LTSSIPFANLTLMKKSGFLFLGLILLPSLAFANVVINEIAWMGSKVDSVDSGQWRYYEWIELYNSGNDAVDLTGWILSIVGKKDIYLENTIPANSFYFIERSGYHAFDNITADLATSFGAGLSNSGATLALKDTTNNQVDAVDGNDNWKIGGGDIIGDNTTKETAQRTSSGWITATATPKAANAGFLQSQPPSQQQPDQSSAGGGSAPYIPPEQLPKIKAYAGEDKTVVVGASAEFRGKAFGLKNEPLDNARYLWNFGDGSSKEGQNIIYFYRYPGEYTVVLNVSSGGYSASDYALVKAAPNNIFISEVKTGLETWIELENGFKEEIDISGCQLKSGNQIFIFPQNSRIRAAANLVIPLSASGFILYSGKSSVEFLYPGGFKADLFNYDGFLSGSESFARDGDKSSIAQVTPGQKNPAKTAVIQKSGKSGVEKFSTSKSQKTETMEVELPYIKDSSSENSGSQPGSQGANVISVGDSGNAKNNAKIYLFAILALILFAGAAVFFIRRQRGV